MIVAGILIINLDPIGKLDHVLHVHKLFISLVLVKGIVSLIPHKIEFDAINASLCDKVRGWKTGLAKVYKGLYYLPSHENTKESVRSSLSNIMYQSNALAAVDTRRGEDKGWLIHQK